jgi:hypothetical protein
MEGEANAAEIVDQYIRAFFDRYLLKKIDVPILDDRYPYDREVRFEQQKSGHWSWTTPIN